MGRERLEEVQGEDGSGVAIEDLRLQYARSKKKNPARKPPLPIGFRCNQLVVISSEEKKIEGTNGFNWCSEVRCDACGGTSWKTNAQLRFGSIKTCGCKHPSKGFDVTGQRFGKLVAVSCYSKPVRSTTRGSNAQRIWVCRCDCGGERHVPLGQLKSGFIHRCMACRTDFVSERLKTFKKGTKFGRLTVIRPAGKNAKHFYCLCRCGVKTRSSYEALRKGQARSCGGPDCRTIKTAKKYEVFGEKLTVREMAEAFDIEAATLSNAIKRGCILEEYLISPPKSPRRTTPEEKEEVLRALRAGERGVDIAERTGLSKTVVSAIGKSQRT